MKTRIGLLVAGVTLLCDGSRAQSATGAQGVVVPAIDVLLRDSAHLVDGRRIGLITNQTAVDAHGVLTLERLRAHAPARVAAIFAPEHHFAATLRPGETFRDSVDTATGIPIYSLYGSNRTPTLQQLAGLDLLMVDLQDVGVRTFTYATTMLLAMRAAKEAGIPIVVLDRPNPIGCLMAGPVLEEEHASFIGMFPVPLRHGMTIGELARFANREMGVRADLRVIPLDGWRRCMWFDETGLPFVPPSPNLPTLESVAWYPGMVLFEATNLSVGRGTDAPFRQVGAPWFDLSRWELLPAYEDTVHFTPRQPGDDKFAGVPLSGIRLERPTRTTDPIDVALRILARVERLYGDSLVVDQRGLTLRLGISLEGRCDNLQCLPELSWNQWPSDVQRFRLVARRYFLYL